MYPVSFTGFPVTDWKFLPIREKHRQKTARFSLPRFQCNGKQCLSGKCLVDSSGKHDFLKTP